MEKYRLDEEKKIRIQDFDPNATPDFNGGKEEGKARMISLNEELESLQELLYAEHKQKVLVILQGMDTSGKDGVVRHVFEGVNPAGVRVVSYKVPSTLELDHDYLWRIHQETPKKGEIVIFNRSHYEDVLVVRVHGLVPKETWKRRYQQIKDFERMLCEEGTTVLKFFLHISPEEQQERLEARLADKNKHWKFSVGDLQERKRWAEYMEAYEDVLRKTSTPEAPWYVVPANRKWYRDLMIAEALVKTLKGFKMTYPQPEQPLEGIVIEPVTPLS